MLLFPEGKSAPFCFAVRSSMRKTDIKKMTLSAMFLALAFVMPFLTGQIPQIGSMLCPMHIPVLLCGFFCGAPWGMLVGFIAPLLRSFVLGMPPMFPTACCMAFELAAYGLVAGWLHEKLPKQKAYVYVSLVSAMIIGRLVWGVAMLCCMGLDTTKFGMTAFIGGAVTGAVPGIILQLIIVPIVVITLEKIVKKD